MLRSANNPETTVRKVSKTITQPFVPPADMTAPVTIFVKPGAGPNCESEFTESFYIPSLYQENPVQPNDPEVYIEDRAEMEVNYVLWISF